MLYKRREYENIGLLAELVISLAGSNSTVERAFSLLTLLLFDRRLRLAHNTIENLLLININDNLWTPSEREEIITGAAQKYETSKRRVRTFDKAPEEHLVIEVQDDDDNCEEEDDDFDEVSSSDAFSDADDLVHY